MKPNKIIKSKGAKESFELTHQKTQNRQESEKRSKSKDTAVNSTYIIQLKKPLKKPSICFWLLLLFLRILFWKNNTKNSFFRGRSNYAYNVKFLVFMLKYHKKFIASWKPFIVHFFGGRSCILWRNFWSFLANCDLSKNFTILVKKSK